MFQKIISSFGIRIERERESKRPRRFVINFSPRKLFSAFLILFFLTASEVLLFPEKTFAYPTYQANSDLVVAGPYDTATSGAGNWGCNATLYCPGSGLNYREFVTIGQKYRIRQSGTISKIKIYTASAANLTGFYIKIWRKNGSNYDLVGTSNNLSNNLVGNDYATIDLSSPIAGVQEGDYYGYLMEWTGGASGIAFYAKTSIASVTTYYVTNSAPSSTNYNWSGQTNLSGAVLPIELYMTAPQAAFIGDSIIAGHPGHYSFLETTATTNINSTIEKQLGNHTGYTYQNMGIGSQTTSNISARFTADVINLKPKIVVIEGGVNDIAGAVAKSTFIANWTSMLDAAQASSYITTVIVLKILPWTNGSTANMQTRDNWNASLATLAAGYSKAIVIDASSYVGQFRAGGDAGNLWDIQTAYNSDGVHFNTAGHGQIAQAIADALPKPSATFDNDFSAWNTGNITVNYNLIQTGGSTNTNISQTGSSGIEYSTDNSTWYDATKGTGGDALTGLTSTASPGTDHSFVWDSAADLPTTEDSTVYLRIRPNDGTTSATDWISSNAFALDNLAPSAFTLSSPVDNSSTSNTQPALSWNASSDSGSGLAKYQLYIDGSLNRDNISSSATSTTPVSALSDGNHTWYIVAVDAAGNTTQSTSTRTVTIDANSPADFSLDSPGDNSYINSERPTFRWKAATTGDATSGLSKYKLEVDNGDSGDFTVDDIPISRTTDYETDKYTIHYDNFSDSDNTNNYISVYTKSSSKWGPNNNDGKLKEGKRSWKVIAYDNAGNTREESRTLFIDRSSPNVEITQLNSLKITNKNTTLKTNTTPTVYGKITDSLVGDKTDNKISSGPKSIEVKIEKQNIFGLFYDIYSLSTVNLNETYWTSSGNKITDNSQNISNKYSSFEFIPAKKLSIGNYKLTFTGKDSAGNSGGSISINLNVTTQNQITTTQITTGGDKKIINKPTQITTINPTPTAKPVNTLAPKTETPMQQPTKTKGNFCILWWCF